jgi:type I restriction enzyme, S subunit
MLADWKPIRLGDVCTKIGSGATPRGGRDVYLARGPYALVRSQNVHNDGFHHDGLAFIGEKHASELDNVEVLRDDVLLNITGDSVARACQVDRRVLPARVNQHVAIIRPESNRLDPRFLRYSLVSPDMQAKMLSWAGSGGTRNALTKGMIESFDVLAPADVNEQRAIAHILGTLDDKIELNRRMSETLEAMARALFKSWFVDFDPVRARSAGRDPGIPKPLADLFPPRLVDSELGEIPEGWGVQRVRDIGTIVCGKTPPTRVSEYFGDAVPFITIPDMHKRIFATSVQRRLSRAGAQSQERKMLPVGAICVSCIATPGLVVIASEVSQTNQQINSVVPKHSNTTYFWYWALRNLGEDIRAGGSGGSVLSNLSTGRFGELRLLGSEARLRSYYHSIVAPLFSRILANEHEARTLAALRDELLPALVSGALPLSASARTLS